MGGTVVRVGEPRGRSTRPSGMRTTYAATAAALVLTLTGCTGEEPDDRPPGDGATTENAAEPSPGVPTAKRGRLAPKVLAIMTGSDEFVLSVITWGSSSCHLFVSRVEVVDGRLEIVDDTVRPLACTLDRRKFVAHPDVSQLDLDGVTEAVIRWNDRPAEVVPIIFGME